MVSPANDNPLIVDSHLDVAWNAIYNGRDLSMSVKDIRAAEGPRAQGIAMTSLTSMGEAGIGLVFATLFAEPAQTWSDIHSGYPFARTPRGYRTPQEAKAQATEMLDLYQRWADHGLIRIITSVADLEDHIGSFWEHRTPGFLISMEGADPVEDPDDLQYWWDRGLRMISLAWGSTRYTGGTGSSDALTDMGRELLTAMSEVGVIHDASHLSEEAFWEAVGLPQRGMCVSHGNARALMRPPAGTRLLVPLNRHLSDQQLEEVGRPHGKATRGVIGLALLNDFLEPTWWFDPRDPDVTVERQGRSHLSHMASIAGWQSIGIGSDVDSGFGAGETARDIDTALDWRRIGDVVPPAERAGVLGGNWLRFLRETLPTGNS
jgi:membrane dipeptidase